MNQNPNKNPLSELTACWDTINDTADKLVKQNKKYHNRSNYTPAVSVDDLAEARWYLGEFIHKNTD